MVFLRKKTAINSRFQQSNFLQYFLRLCLRSVYIRAIVAKSIAYGCCSSEYIFDISCNCCLHLPRGSYSRLMTHYLNFFSLQNENKEWRRNCALNISFSTSCGRISSVQVTARTALGEATDRQTKTLWCLSRRYQKLVSQDFSRRTLQSLHCCRQVLCRLFS